MMINYKIIDFLKDEIKLSYNSLNCKDLEILARYSIDNIKFIDIEYHGWIEGLGENSLAFGTPVRVSELEVDVCTLLDLFIN